MRPQISKISMGSVCFTVRSLVELALPAGLSTTATPSVEMTKLWKIRRKQISPLRCEMTNINDTGSIAMQPNPRIFLSAGEASGDHYGAQLIHALREALPAATFTGLGGTEMETAGQQRIVRAEDVAVMGITEILRHIPHIYASYRKLVRSIRAQRPDVAILIDFPDVNFRLAKHLKRLGVPVVWFVSPQLWAWKRSRLRWVQQRVSKMMVIFPFEEPFYKARGVDATFVGHPLAELPLPTISRERYAAQHGLDPSAQWIALLPGSRAKEVSANLPEMLTRRQRPYKRCSSLRYEIPVSASGSSNAEARVRYTSYRSMARSKRIP